MKSKKALYVFRNGSLKHNYARFVPEEGQGDVGEERRGRRVGL